MKTLIALLLALGALGGIAKADRILIYKGSITQRIVGASAARNYVANTGSSAYYFFDLDTSGYNFISYSDIKGKKTLHVNNYTTAPFINSPISLSSKTTESSFVISTSTTGTPYTVSIQTFTGVNVPENFGGIFTGGFPVILRFAESGVSGDGSLANDIEFSGSGVFSLDLSLTKGDNPTVAAAVDGVATYLSGIGYTPQ